ncbi:MAG: MCE family protein [Gammaproteobacteria bacterium]|nr:MCE family protein [Gammaproteobacteria bacterium]
MAILHDEDTRFKGLEKKIGLFVIIALLGIVLAIVAVGIQHDVFSPKTRLFFITDSGQSIDEGMAVKLSGFNIGKVEKLELTDDAKVRVTLSILRSYMKWVKGDSKARLLKEGVIGANVIEISPGSDKEKSLEHNALIAFERERGLGQVVDQLYAEVIPLIEDLKRVARRADTLLAGLPGTQQKLDDALTSAKKNFDNLEKVTGSDLPAITKRGRETVEKAGKVVDSVSRTWPISGNIKESHSETLPVDSYSDGANPKQK